MSEYTFMLPIAGVLLIGAMSPGPSFLVVAQHALVKSRAHGIATAIGTGLGVAVFAMLASVGVTTLIEKIPTAYLVLKLIGGVYLLYLAYRIWSGASEPIGQAVSDQATSGSTIRSITIGLITQLSNPKTALVIAGIFAAFVPADPPANTALLVSGMAFVIDFSWYAVVAIVLSTQRTRGFYQRAKLGFDRTAAIFLGAVGLRLIISKIE